MFDSSDLRSGTAPNYYPKKRGLQADLTFHQQTEVIRPKTRDTTENPDLSELNTSLRMNRRKQTNTYLNEFGSNEDFRTTQSNSEFVASLDQIRKPHEYSLDRKLETISPYAPSFSRRKTKKTDKDSFEKFDDNPRRSFLNTPPGMSKRGQKRSDA
jgi:hypothetical protein